MKIKNRNIRLSTIGFALAASFAITASPAALADGTLFVTGDQVGINIETPLAGAKLHVLAASTGPVDAIYLENTTGPSRLKLVNQAATNGPTTNKEWTINSNGDLRFAAPAPSAGGPEMRIFANGVVQASGGFSVAGTPLNVPDYVFEPGYELLPLSDVQAFVQQNGHLPNVPSAAEVNQDGLNMTDMQLVLLRKVEELTLYTIQQQKTIDDLQNRLEDYSH